MNEFGINGIIMKHLTEYGFFLVFFSARFGMLIVEVVFIRKCLVFSQWSTK